VRIVQVSFFVDPRDTDPEVLLDEWSGLTVPAEAASRAGCEVAVVQASSVERRVLRGDVVYHFVADRRPGPLRRRLGRWAAPMTPRVLERVGAPSPALVHVHGLSYPRHVARLAARLRGTPILLQDHADRPPPGWRMRSYRASMQRARGVLFTAAEQARPFLESGALPADVRIFEVPESTSRFTPGAQQAARTRTGVHGDPCFLWVGRLDANKDPLTVLEAFARAAGALPGARLWMCYGDAPLLAEVRAKLGRDPLLAGRVALLGRRPHADVEQLLRAADFLVLGSHREGSGYAVIESLACGTTPLVTDIPSFRRLTGDGAIGALSPPGDAEAMARAMTAWAGKPKDVLRRAALAHFERHLSFAAVGERLRSAYESVLSTGALRSSHPGTGA
jgi:glycosyltransferase involved in cell wall biosynthesis